MGRSSVVTPELRAAIARHDGPGVTLDTLRARLEGEGFQISRATLGRHVPRQAISGPPTGAAGAVARAADAAVVAGELAPLYAARDEVAAGLAKLAPKLGRDHRAVRSYARLVEIQTKIARAIVECTPRPPEERYAPVEAAALAALLTRAQGAADADELGALRDRVAAQADAIQRLTFALADAGAK